MDEVNLIIIKESASFPYYKVKNMKISHTVFHAQVPGLWLEVSVSSQPAIWWANLKSAPSVHAWAQDTQAMCGRRERRQEPSSPEYPMGCVGV